MHEQLPDVLLQWEDFATAHAQPILERYRDKLLTFNDDIQGTAAVTLGALHGASKVAGRPLSQQQVVMLGAGSAGIGVLGMVQREMVAQGLSEAEAAERIWVVDVVGLLTDDRTDLSPGQRQFAQPANRVAGWGLSGPAQLADVVHNVDVGILMGLSTAAGAFTEEIVRELAGKTRAAHHLSAVQPDQPRRGAPGRVGRMDRWARADRDRLTVRAAATRRGERPDCPVQQRLHLPRHGARRDRGAGHPGHRRHDEGRGRHARRRFACACPTRLRRCCPRGRTFPTSPCASPMPSAARPSRTVSHRRAATKNWPSASREVHWTPEYPA